MSAANQKKRPVKGSNVLLSPRDIEKVEAAVDNAIRISESLLAVAEEENRRLSSGRPRPIDDLLENKQKLSRELAEFLDLFKAQSNLFLLASPQKFAELQAVNDRLTKALSDNSQNLVRALNASKRRVQTIMRAIRDKQSANARYDNRGGYGQNPVRPISVGRRYEA